ncbi:MAG: Pup--protein ligase, partial [Actinomycetota bacterium]
MDRRIFGLESEYGVTCAFKGQRRLSPDEAARYLFRRVVAWGRSSNVFLENGARLYLDVGSHPEYATPECDSIEQLAVYDRAGERILESLTEAAELRVAEEEIASEVFVFKNNTDSSGNSYGCHENYLVARLGEFSDLTDLLIPFFVTRQVICGAGKVLQTPRGPIYAISQRGDHIWEGVSSATTRSRPIINTRDEPHADAERFRRLHVIVGDSNMSAWTTCLKVGSTDLVLRMLEEGGTFRDLSLENPIRAIREISHDSSCRRRVRLANGRDASAVEIQREYFERAAAFLGRRGGSAWDRRIIGMWEHVLESLETQDYDAIGRQVDWAIKLALIERFRRREGLGLAHPRVALIDLAYHDVKRT